MDYFVFIGNEARSVTQQTKRYLMYIAQNYSYAILRPLQQAILAQGGEVCWFIEGKEATAKYLQPNERLLTSVKEVKAWQPDAVFVPGNVVPSFIPGVKVGVFHGFNSGKLNRRGREDHFEIRGCFDLYCTQGPDTTEPFKQLAAEHGFFQVVETGWPALDPLFKPSLDNLYVDVKDERPTILMCSTFSRNLTCAPILFEKIKALSKTGRWRWLIQFHPKMDADIVKQYKSIQNENLTFVETDNVLPLLQAADVMLCDTSSILLMFLMQRKPVVTFRNQSPGSYLINILEPEEVEPALEKALLRPSDIMEEINEYCNTIHPYSDGLSSQRVLEATNSMIDCGIKHLKAKPLNLLRQFKMRNKLGYWWL
ncbi:CDP-glycerol: N-acetyl-beta-D-mannosaminyl-1,4-N-acetyl-D-glucosaminyldiphosphoundecaprenyl glycerophosphotransferase [Photobacterium aphoticum]|uniref:CDP-glycerol: N-acetyl-beta-D-mannosaminyl-1,4-N-acetyl-D-glucosaminyldiphosphoundecaprenyl glycerophosphotransferase n=1 Tax=Photobacterium aphoticum TaxID=754436 RepID=A0A090QV88_9GAMM|nr:CDP-glycerol: N-acetyl-beta-D-mannosaminyl-1,4-N-acetyl-D-glucosaminyldiphosphoundecaprenyl glycerophosphotransferase [Photobacterium aphoticum]